MPTYDYLCPNGHRFEVIHSRHRRRPDVCPICGAAPVRKAFSAADDPLQGHRLGEEGPRARAAPGRSSTARRRTAGPRRAPTRRPGGDEPDAAPDKGSTRASGTGRRSSGAEAAEQGRRRATPASASGSSAAAASRRPTEVPSSAADWISLAEAAEILEAANIHFKAVDDRRRGRGAGKLQSIKLGGRRFVRRGEVKALVAPPRRVRAERPPAGPVRGDPGLTDAGPDPRPARGARHARAARRGRHRSSSGYPRVALARRVLDRFGAADGGLLAAGVAYNAVLALIPLGLLATGVRRRPAERRRAAGRPDPVAGRVPAAAGRRRRRDRRRDAPSASPSLSLVGLVLAAWGTSRLFASLESAIAQMDARRDRAGASSGGPPVGSGSIVVLAGSSCSRLARDAGPRDRGRDDRRRRRGPARSSTSCSRVVPPVLAGVALAAVYRVVPPSRPRWRAIGPSGDRRRASRS